MSRKKAAPQDLSSQRTYSAEPTSRLRLPVVAVPVRTPRLS